MPLRAQAAFKDLMIHEILQFTLRIAFRCVLHRCESQEIRCQKLFLFRFLRHFSGVNAGHLATPKNSTVHRVDALAGLLSNDPTAGSPTVTLLRLLLPLNDQV